MQTGVRYHTFPMHDIKHICLQIMPPSMTESLGASKRQTALYITGEFLVRNVFFFSSLFMEILQHNEDYFPAHALHDIVKKNIFIYNFKIFSLIPDVLKFVTEHFVHNFYYHNHLVIFCFGLMSFLYSFPAIVTHFWCIYYFSMHRRNVNNEN